eukprot:TRINITY_DN5790_c0_g2_i1.p1 TRINITY_DN5790_c0_g2~~TRINITY_DN5790_c0_g2_i1.p1  ORF type:complete len:319 (+),score=17.78 TRINITY_DN5790_c0_g2_i1:108-959(+)
MFVTATEMAEKSVEIHNKFTASPECTLVIDITPLLTPTECFTLTLTSTFLPPCVKHVIMTDPTSCHVINLAQEFLSYNRNIRTIEFQFTVGRIGPYFMFGCSSLQSIIPPKVSNLNGASKYGGVQGPFLHGCVSLQSIDLTPFSGLINLGPGFLFGCSSLRALDLSPFNDLEGIGSDFLAECTGLTSIDLTPLHKLKSAENGFLYRCTSLTFLDLRPLTNLKVIGSHFASSCHNLTEIKANPFPPNICRIIHSQAAHRLLKQMVREYDTPSPPPKRPTQCTVS